jgi:uncharacterized protein
MSFAVRCAGASVAALCTWCLSAFALPAAVLDDPFDNAITAYEHGDYAAAAVLFMPLAQSGNAPAQMSLGELYYEGEGVPQNYDEALNWYRKAADAGLPRAQLRIGLMYSEGRSVQQDRSEAVKWYRLAADEGLPDAQYNLALAYDFGEGLPQNYAEAVRWYQFAAEQGLALAQNNLGAMYEYGQGIAQDLGQAYKWYSIAAAHFGPSEHEERERSLKNRANIVNKMSAKQIAEAQDLADKWKPRLSW